MKNKALSVLMAGCICCSSAMIMPYAEAPAHALTIIAHVTNVSVVKEVIAIGESVQLELEWSTGAKQQLFYSSSDESVATVDDNGLVTGISDGSAVINITHSNSGKNVTITITVSSDVEKSTHYNSSELTLGTKLKKYDSIHYDNKNLGGLANVVNTKGSYDLAFISEKDYVLPFDAELVGIDGSTFYLAPDIEGITYLDGRTLDVGDTVDRNTHLLCYDYHINNYVLPVFLPKYYEKYIGEGEIRVKAIDHDKKTITLEAVPSETTTAHKLYAEITRKPFDTVIHGYDELDLTGLTLSIVEYDENGTEIQRLTDASLDEIWENYDVTVNIKAEEPGSGTCIITVSKKDADIADSASFSVSYGAPIVKGDVNADGSFGIADVVMLQKWLLSDSDTQLVDWQRADMCRDGKLDVYDLCLMKKALLEESQKSFKIPDGYIAVFHRWNGQIGRETYIYKLDNGAANYGFAYINVEIMSGVVPPVTTVLIDSGEVMWTDEVFIVAEANDAYDYVTIPNDDKIYAIEEFMEIFLMN